MGKYFLGTRKIIKKKKNDKRGGIPIPFVTNRKLITLIIPIETCDVMISLK